MAGSAEINREDKTLSFQMAARQLYMSLLNAFRGDNLWQMRI